MATGSLLSRVLLPKKEITVTEETFVPGGSPVPAQFKIPLLKKLPMFPAPTKALELYSSKLGELAYINKKRYGFDLFDPYNRKIDTTYRPEQDPHMQHVLKTPEWRQKLKDLGQVTEHDMVRVTLKEFNQFRGFLKHKSLNELRKKLAEERRQCPKIDLGDNLEVVAIETRVHAQEVQSRRMKTEEETQEKFKTLVTQTEKKVTLRKRKDEFERKYVTSKKLAARAKHRDDVYRKAMKMARQRARNVLNAWKQKMQDYIEHMRQVEEDRIEDREAKLQEKWTLRRQNQLAWEELVDTSRAAVEERRERTVRLLDAEMTRRWQEQAGKLQTIKDVSRRVQADREEAYARNLMRAFAKSRLLNPEGADKWLSDKGQSPQKTDGARRDDKLEDKVTLTISQYDSNSESKTESKSSSGDSRLEVDEDGLPHFKTIFSKPVKRSCWVLEKEVKKMGLNPRLHPIGGHVSDKELINKKSDYDAAKAACSGSTIEAVFVAKWKKKKAKIKKTYPTSVEVAERVSAPGEVICVYKAREDIVSEMPEVKKDKAHDGSDEEEESDQENEDESKSSSSAESSGLLPGVAGENAVMMQGLLAKLLEDLRNGKVDDVDLLQLAALCSGMTSDMRLEEATSTTSLMAHEIVAHSMARLGEDIVMGRLSPADLLAVMANLRAADSDSSSVSSGRLEQLVCETMDRANASMDADEEGHYLHFLEETLKITVSNLRCDIERGTLSRTNIQEIGSALALAVMGDAESDESLMADDTLLTTLQQLQQDIDAGQIQEYVLDKALASLISAYSQVTRGRSNLEIIKDFVLYVLLRTKQDLGDKKLDNEVFLKELQAAKIDTGNYAMELPDLAELEKAASKAIGKFKGLAKPDQVVVDLIKTILGTGRRIMPGIARSRVPRISQSMIEQAGDSACQLEVVLDLTAGVCTSFTRHMNEDSSFALVAENILGARFLIIIFSHWGQLDQDLPKDTVAVQTITEELAHVTCVRASLAENVVVVCFSWLWQDALENNIPVCIMPHVALDVAEFPNTTPLLDPVRSMGSYEEKIEQVDDVVLKKVRKLGQELQEGARGFDEAEALLTICLHAYLNEVVYCDCSADIKVDGTEPPGMISNVNFLVSTCARSVLEHIQNRVARRLSALGYMAVELSFVTEILFETAQDALGALSTFVTNDATAAEDELSLLEPIILTTQSDMLGKASPKQKRGAKAFLQRLVGMDKRASTRPVKRADQGKSFKVVSALIRRDIWRLAKEVVHLFSGLASLHNLLPSAISSDKSEAMNTVTSFFVSLLLELRRALEDETLPLDVAFDFVKSIDDKCPDAASESVTALSCTVLDVVKNIELKQSASPCYVRLVQKLSQMSLERRRGENVAEGMAAIAHMLSKADQVVLTTFLQTTLLSLLQSVRALRSDQEQDAPAVATVASVPEEESEDEIPSKGLITEAKIIVHVALQKTLEKLGASPLPADYPSDSSQGVAQDSVCQTQDSKAERSEGTGRDNSLAAYAQGLATEISHQLQDEANAGTSLSTRSIANVIIDNTLKSINAAIKSGKIQVSVTPHDTESEETVASDSSLSHRLSVCVCTTLKAVKSELNLLHLLESGILMQDDSALSGEDSKEAIEKARRIVDFLIKRVETDVEEARVEFQLTEDNQLSIVRLSQSSLQPSKGVTSDISNNFWKGSPTTMTIFVLNTFRDVLTELHTHNEFFDPRKTLPAEGVRRDTSVMPGLPYVMDNFILTHLLETASAMVASAADPAKAVPRLCKEAAAVARTFHSVVQRMMQESLDAQAEDAEMREMMARRQFVLGALDKVLQVCLCDQTSPTALPGEQASTASGTGVAGDRAVGGQLAAVLGVMQKIMTSVHQTSEGATASASTAVVSPAPGDSNVLGDVIVQAVQQMALYIREGRVNDQDLARLCRAFGGDLRQDASMEDKQAKALGDLEALVVDLRQGKIPRSKLQQAAQQLSIRVLEKDSCAPSSPGDWVASPRASLSSPSVGISLSTQNLLKQAVSGLMTELMNKGQVSDEGTGKESKDESKVPSVVSSRKGSLDVAPSLLDPVQEPREEKDEGMEKPFVSRSRRMSVHDRTVSKTDVRDSTENRMDKVGSTRIYSLTEPTLPLVETSAEEDSRDLEPEAESFWDNSLPGAEGLDDEPPGDGTEEEPTGLEQEPEDSEEKQIVSEDYLPGTPVSDRHCMSEPTLVEHASETSESEGVMEMALGEADDTESQLAAEAADAAPEHAPEDTNASSLADDTSADSEGNAAQDWNRSAVTSSRTNHLAHAGGEAESNSNSLPPSTDKATGSERPQKSGGKKTGKRKKRGTRVRSPSSHKTSLEELISPLEKWKKLINEISQQREREESLHFNEGDLSQSTSSDRKALKQKKSLRKRSTSKVRKATPAKIREEGSSQISDLTPTASDPLPAETRVEERHMRRRQSTSSQARKVRRWSLGTLRETRIADPEPRFDPFFPEDAPAKVSSYFGRHSLQTAPATSDGNGPSGSHTSPKLSHVASRVSGDVSGPSGLQTRSKPTHVSPKISIGGSGSSDSHTSSMVTNISPKVSTGRNLSRPKIMKGHKGSQDKSKAGKALANEATRTPVQFATVTPLPPPEPRTVKSHSVPSSHEAAPDVQKTERKTPVQKAMEDSPYSSDRKSVVPTLLQPKMMSRADIEEWLRGQQKKHVSARTDTREVTQLHLHPRLLRKAASSGAKLQPSGSARAGRGLSPPALGEQRHIRQRQLSRPETKQLQEQQQQQQQEQDEHQLQQQEVQQPPLGVLPRPPTRSLPCVSEKNTPRPPPPSPKTLGKPAPPLGKPAPPLGKPAPPLGKPAPPLGKPTPLPAVDIVRAEEARPRVPTHVRPLGMTRSYHQKTGLASSGRGDLAQQLNRNNNLVSRLSEHSPSNVAIPRDLQDGRLVHPKGRSRAHSQRFV